MSFTFCGLKKRPDGNGTELRGARSKLYPSVKHGGVDSATLA
jgi:hypothetical protein